MIKRSVSTLRIGFIGAFIFSAAAQAHWWENRVEHARRAAYDVERESRQLVEELRTLRAETFPGHQRIKEILGTLQQKAGGMGRRAREFTEMIQVAPVGGNWAAHFESTKTSFAILQDAYGEFDREYTRFFHEIAEHENGPGRHRELHNIHETYQHLQSSMTRLIAELPRGLK